MYKIKIYKERTNIEGTNLLYLDTKSKGPAILCLHGRWGRAETWAEFIKRYGKEYRVIAPDQSGRSLSGDPISVYTPEEMAENLKLLLDDLDIQSTIIVSHSMGGRIASYFTHLYPNYVKALVILDRWSIGKNNMASDLLEDFMELEEEDDDLEILPEIECPVLLVTHKVSDELSNEGYSKVQALISNCTVKELSNDILNKSIIDRDEFYGVFDEYLRTMSLL